MIEDLIVSGCGFLTSTAVAYASHFMSKEWDFAPYTWMVNWILPAGALFCGFVAAIGYWIGARIYHHRPSKMLLANIVLISCTTFFAIHHLDYSEARVNGMRLQDRMSFTDYLVAVTESMSYKSSRSSSDDSPTELGKLGWGVALLQIVGFSLGGFGVYGMLVAVPYCERCSKYLSEKQSRTAKWKDVELLREAFAKLVQILGEGRLQDALDAHAGMGNRGRFGGVATLTMELRKCPACENRRLRLVGHHQKGNKHTSFGPIDIPTEEPLRMS
ncbi:MAG: hypothetical protein K8R23_14105 [Chthoniobacter sp.]|nr:hypothetical protein [Chthoniobacter sp.]